MSTTPKAILSLILGDLLQALRINRQLTWTLDDIEPVFIQYDEALGVRRLVVDVTVPSEGYVVIRSYVYAGSAVFTTDITNDVYTSNNGTYAGRTLLTYSHNLKEPEFSGILNLLYRDDYIDAVLYTIPPNAPLPCALGTISVNSQFVSYSGFSVLQSAISALAPTPGNGVQSGGLYYGNVLHIAASPLNGTASTALQTIPFSEPDYNPTIGNTTAIMTSYSAESMCWIDDTVYFLSGGGSTISSYNFDLGVTSSPNAFGTTKLVRADPSGTTVWTATTSGGNFNLIGLPANLSGTTTVTVPAAPTGVTPEGVPLDMFVTSTHAYISTSKGVFKVDLITRVATNITSAWIDPNAGYNATGASPKRMTLLSDGNIYLVLKNTGATSCFGVLFSTTGSSYHVHTLPTGVSTLQRPIEVQNGNVVISQADTSGVVALEIVPSTGVYHQYGTYTGISSTNVYSQSFIGLDGTIWTPRNTASYVAQLLPCPESPPLSPAMITAIKSSSRNYI